jgi:hypothetical protein
MSCASITFQDAKICVPYNPNETVERLFQQAEQLYASKTKKVIIFLFILCVLKLNLFNAF